MRYKILLVSMAGVLFTLFFSLTSDNLYAEGSEVIDHVYIQIPVACTLSGTGTNSHNATINNGQYNSAVGETTLKAVCNDYNGFAIYATGYTDDTNGKNVLTASTLGSTFDIATGTGTTGDSQWAMKLSTITSPEPTYPIVIQNSFNNFHTVPDNYTLVAKRESATDSGDNPEGSTLKTTYQAYISPTQPSDTYTGQVKYILVHPHSTPTPHSTMLDIGFSVCTKMKTLAAGTDTDCETETDDIKSIRMAESLPANFVATDANTVSDSALSKYPIYIFYDNTNDAGIMYFYTGGYQVVLNPNSEGLFYGNYALDDISGLATWDTSNVTDMAGMFCVTPSLTSIDALANWDVSNVTNMNAVFSSMLSLTSIDALANWDVSKVTDMYGMFAEASSLTSLDGLVNWDVSSVTDMSYLFYGTSSLTSIDALANWDVSSATVMYAMFTEATSLTSISALADWDVSNVTDMGIMFASTSSLTSLNGLDIWDVSSVTNMNSMFYDTSRLTSIDALADWNVSNVTDMGCLFEDASSLTSVTALADWNVSKVKNMSRMFHGATSLVSADGLADWNTSSVNTLYALFDTATSLTSISALADWDVSNVSDIAYLFSEATSLTSIDALADWHFTKVKDMRWIFYKTAITSVTALANWNVSTATHMNYMFKDVTTLTSLDGLARWDVSKVTNMSYMFSGCTNLASVSAINNWDVRAVVVEGVTTPGFTYMFRYVPVHPTFTLVSGTWDNNGTFTPST